MSIRNHWGEAEAVPVASVGCVVECPFGISFAARFWVEALVGPGFSEARQRQDATAKSKASGIMSFPQGNQTSASLSGVGAGLLFFFLRAESGFLGGVVEDMCDRVSEVAVSRAWAHCSMITKAVEDLTTQGTL